MANPDNRKLKFWQLLNPANTQIDARDNCDRFAFVAKFADCILYYDKENFVAGTWQPFFLKDPLILLAAISKTDYEEYHTNFSQLQQNAINAPTLGASVIGDLFALLHKMFCIINDWFRYMEMNPDSYQLYAFLAAKIKTNLAQQLSALLSLQNYLAKNNILDANNANIQFYDDFSAIWKNNYGSAQQLYLPQILNLLDNLAASTDKTEIISTALNALQNIFNAVLDVFVQTIDGAQQAFLTMTNQTTRHPDIALLVAFTNLLQQQATQLNQLSQKHLDFYYLDVLQQSMQAAQADQVYVCLKLAPGIANFTLPAASEFVAGNYPDQSPILYTSSADVELNQAAIARVNTVFYQVQSKQDSSLYFADIATPSQIVLNQAQEILSWDAFGNANNSPIQQGFAFASPMLFLQGGSRAITIKLTFENNVNLNYFNNSQCYLSTADAWLPLMTNTGAVNSVSASLSNNADGASLTLQILLPLTAPAIAAFPKNPDGYTSKWPIFKMMVASNANLADVPSLQNVSIAVQVQNLNQFVLCNADGILPVATPSLIFGPTPDVGSSFYIGCSEAFAKPLSEVSLTQNWDNLPADFSNYYAAYNQYLLNHPAPAVATPAGWPVPSGNNSKVAIFYNNAFLGAWSLLNQSGWNSLTPKHAASQVSMFQQNVSNSTAITPPNLPQSTFSFEFSNSNFVPLPDLILAPLPVLAKAENGYLCFQLQTPSSGFGFALYANVLADIALKNAQTLMSKASAGNNKAKGLTAVEQVLQAVAPKAAAEIEQISSGVAKIPVIGPMLSKLPVLGPLLSKLPLAGALLTKLPVVGSVLSGLSGIKSLASSVSNFLGNKLATAKSWISNIFKPKLGGAQQQTAPVIDAPLPLSLPQPPLAEPSPTPNPGEQAQAGEDDSGTTTATTSSVDAKLDLMIKVQNAAKCAANAAAYAANAANAANAATLNPNLPSTLQNQLVNAQHAANVLQQRANNLPAPTPAPTSTTTPTATTSAPTFAPAPTLTIGPNPEAAVDAGTLLPMPNPPYSPKQTSLQLNYQAQANIEIGNANVGYPMQMFHYGCFGNYLAYDAANPGANLLQLTPQVCTNPGSLPLLAGVAGEGCMYIGLQGVQAPCNLRLLFELSLPASAPALTAQSLSCFYWDSTGWTALPPFVNDTNEWNNSGIVEFQIPTPTFANNTADIPATQYYSAAAPMPPELFWLAIATQQPGISMRISYLNTQALKLTRSTLAALPAGQVPAIAANSISGPLNKIAQIAALAQASPSFGGNAADVQQDSAGINEFYCRISQRIQNKDRVSSRNNYEEMAYQADANLYFAKAITTPTLACQIKPAATPIVIAPSNGLIQIGVVKAYANPQLPDAFRPNLSSLELAQIESYIATKVSAMSTVHAFNMLQQELMLQVRLLIAAETNATALCSQVNQALKVYLSPWIQSDLPQADLSQGVNRSAVVNFLLTLPQVLGVAELTLCPVPIPGEPVQINPGTAWPANDETILVSAAQHQIHTTVVSNVSNIAAGRQLTSLVASNG